MIAALNLTNLSLLLFSVYLQGHLSHGTLREAEPTNHGDCTTGSTPDCSPPSPDTALKNIERVIRPQVSALTCTRTDALPWINATAYAAAEASNALLSITAATYEPLKHLQPPHRLTNRPDSDWFVCSVSIIIWIRVFDCASNSVYCENKPKTIWICSLNDDLSHFHRASAVVGDSGIKQSPRGGFLCCVAIVHSLIIESSCFLSACDMTVQWNPKSCLPQSMLFDTRGSLHIVNQPVSRKHTHKWRHCTSTIFPFQRSKVVDHVLHCQVLNPDHRQLIRRKEKNWPLTHACTGISRGARQASAWLEVHTIKERHGSIWRHLINSGEFISFRISAASGGLCRHAHWARSSRLPCSSLMQL